MKFLLDENISPQMGKELKKAGHDVTSIVELQKTGLSDDEVYKLSCIDNRILITINGKDFENFDFSKSQGIIWIRVHPPTPRNYVPKVLDFLSRTPNIKNKLATIRRDGSFSITEIL